VSKPFDKVSALSVISDFSRDVEKMSPLLVYCAA